MANLNEPLRLIDGNLMPRVGLGVFKSPVGEETENAVKWALETGYRHIDTAAYYQNEANVGAALRASGLPREEVWVTTKLWNDDIRARRAKAAFHESLEKLGLEYVDLYLIHWAVDGFVEAWRDMQELKAEGLIRSVGVSNFNPHHIQELLKNDLPLPAVNQIESHPSFPNAEVVKWCQDHNIAVTCWRPIGGGTGSADELSKPELATLADKYGKSPAQIVLRWHLQRGVIAIPKSVHENRIKENFDIFDFELTDEDMVLIDTLDVNARAGADPDHVTF